jgi:hypothetical protein
VGQQEMQRRSAAIEDDGVKHVAQRPGRDQPRDGLVFVQRFPGDIGQQACAEQRSEPDERKRGPGGDGAAWPDLMAFAHGCAQGAEP